MLAFLLNSHVMQGALMIRYYELMHLACSCCSILQTLLPDYQKLLASAPARRLNSAKLLENSGEFRFCVIGFCVFSGLLGELHVPNLYLISLAEYYYKLKDP